MGRALLLAWMAAWLLPHVGIVGAVGFEAYCFTVHKKEYRFTTSFEIDSHDTYPGKVDKSPYSIRTWYYLYDQKGDEQAYAICSFFCLGTFYDWATEIYVYKEDRLVGWIDGQMGTTAAAKFSFYDGSGQRVGIAYLDRDKTGFGIVDAESGNVRLASLKRHFLPGTDHWSVIVYRPEISQKLLRIFAAFVIDRQNSWKKET
jgi:hypothetical protein